MNVFCFNMIFAFSCSILEAFFDFSNYQWLFAYWEEFIFLNISPILKIVNELSDTLKFVRLFQKTYAQILFKETSREIQKHEAWSPISSSLNLHWWFHCQKITVSTEIAFLWKRFIYPRLVVKCSRAILFKYPVWKRYL